MLGKIAGIGLVTLLTLALVGGSAYILLRPPDTPVFRTAHGQTIPDAATDRGNDDGGRWGHGHGSEVDHEGGEHPVETWTTVTGTVVALDPDLVLQTEEGEVVIHLGPEWYWGEQGPVISVGDQVAATGFFEHNGLEATRIENLTTGQSLILRDGSGRPLRAGRGRRGGR
ncbi:MAG TPA: hypothetical protein EYH27_02395 [Anaerolineales bacterium]|nr:hypothetical protein [Anaerolineae bacterium]HIP87272.1 hypothetical protein [Anaerolineales bacterium]